MTTKIVCRLLDASDQLLGWTEMYAKARGDGKLWSQGPVVIVAEREGTSAHLSVHWVDVNVDLRMPFVISMAAGQLVTIYDEPNTVIK